MRKADILRHMNLLSVNNLSKIGREKNLFAEVTFGLDEGEKAALIGRNGTGKSTMLNVIAGKIPADGGSVTVNREAGVSFLPQNPVFEKNQTIRSHVFSSSSPKLKIIGEYEEICARFETDKSAQKKFDELTQKMEKGDLWNYESQIKSVLTTLGLHDLDKKMGELSGGMVKKVALAQVLVEDTRILLLDEPTNHLDAATIFWLQNYLAETKRSVLMVTHDRYFLDAVCTKIYELDREKVRLYAGNYSVYLEKKATELQIESNTERRIESVLRFERDWLSRGPCARGTKAKARIRRDESLINREKFSADKEFSFHVEGRRLGGKILEIKNVSKNFQKGFAEKNSAPVLKNFSYTFSRGEKIGLFGGNGSGKSTLLNIIAQKIQPDSGEISAGENTHIGYYEQNPVFSADGTVLEYIREAAEVVKNADGTELSASLFLEQFGFSGRIQHSPVDSLSGGEKKRLYLVRLLISNPNFLILDEPTNDFDIFTMNVLEKFLSDFRGCLLVASHDRCFMDKTCDTLFVLEDDGGISGFAGKCSEYIDFCAQKKSAEKQKNPAGKKSRAENPVREKKKLSFKEKKELEELEQKIFAAEDQKKILEDEMASADYEKSRAAGEKYSALEAELAQFYSRWEELSAKEN